MSRTGLDWIVPPSVWRGGRSSLTDGTRLTDPGVSLREPRTDATSARPPTSLGSSASSGTARGHRPTGAHGASEYFPYFDWLRLLLATVVCFQHFGLIRWELSGNFAVQIFFALSGWLIGGILLELRAAELPDFFYKRATRIWIPYAFALLVFYTVAALRGIDYWWLKSLFFDLTFTHNLFTYYPDFQTAIVAMPLKGTARHFWSISVEEQFYLVAPFVIVLTSMGSRFLFWIMAASVSLYFGFNASAICLGVAGAIFFQGRIDVLNDRRVRCGLGLFLATMLVLLYLVKDGYSQFAPLSAVSIVLLCAIPGNKQAIGSFAGGMSYPLYLNHWLGIYGAHIVQKVFGLRGETFVIILAYGLAVVVAAVLYKFIDRNVILHRYRYFTRNRGFVVMSAAILIFITGLTGGLIIISA